MIAPVKKKEKQQVTNITPLNEEHNQLFQDSKLTKR
jgi:hypothetical protein